MTLSWKEWKISDILYAIIVPLIVAFVIIAFPAYLRPILHNIDQSFTLESIFILGFEEAILAVGVPLLIGLIWNQWAGGAAGFLLGSIYAIASFTINGLTGDQNFFLLGYVLSAILIGYVGGALNKGSTAFLRMLIAGIVAAIIGGLFLYFTELIPQPINMAAPDYTYSLLLTLLPRIIYGVIIPVIAKFFVLFGVSPRKMA